MATAIGSARIPTTARAICAAWPSRPSGSSGTKNTAKTIGDADEEDLQLPALVAVRAAGADDQLTRAIRRLRGGRRGARRPRARPRRRRRRRSRAGLAPADGTSSSTGPGRIAIEVVASTIVAAAATPTIHQRRVGGRPVGKSSGTIVTTKDETRDEKQVAHEREQLGSRQRAGVRERPVGAVGAREEVRLEAQRDRGRTPSRRGFAGCRAMMSAPTSAYARCRTASTTSSAVATSSPGTLVGASRTRNAAAATNAAERPRSAQPARDDEIDPCSFTTSSFVRSSCLRVTLGRARHRRIGRGSRSRSAPRTSLVRPKSTAALMRPRLLSATLVA